MSHKCHLSISDNLTILLWLKTYLQPMVFICSCCTFCSKLLPLCYLDLHNVLRLGIKRHSVCIYCICLSNAPPQSASASKEKWSSNFQHSFLRLTWRTTICSDKTRSVSEVAVCIRVSSPLRVSAGACMLVPVCEVGGCFVCFREIGETQAAMKTVEESKSQLLVTTNELQQKLEASNDQCRCMRLKEINFCRFSGVYAVLQWSRTSRLRSVPSVSWYVLLVSLHMALLELLNLVARCVKMHQFVLVLS